MSPFPPLSREQFDALDGDRQFALFVSMRDQLSEMAGEIQLLRDQVARNSRNSGKPPSSDGFTKPRPKSLRAKGKRKSGGQPGHVGKTLERVATPDHVVRHPLVSCPSCAGDLTDSPSHGIETRQVFDLPLMKFEVTEHQAEVKLCRDCAVSVKGAFPPTVTQPTQYGSRVKSLAVYLSNYQFLPLARLRELFFDLYGHAPSESWIVSASKEMVDEIAPALEAIREQLVASPVLHSDETGLRVEGRLNWLHSAGTERLTFYAVHPKRGWDAMHETGILPRFQGRAVHDAFASYFKFDQCSHALCNAHHLRELKFVEDEYEQAWASEMTDLLLEIKDEVGASPPELASLPRERLAHYERGYDTLLQRGFEANPPPTESPPNTRGRKKQSPPKNLLDRLSKWRDETLVFMRDFRVPFDNNLAERDVRMRKVKQKISGTFRTRAGAETFCAIRSYISTARKQGQRVLNAIHDALLANPFIPAAHHAE